MPPLRGPTMPVRSLLFAPGNRPELLKKFLRYPADAFAIDLEDGTPEADKASARTKLQATVTYLREHGLKGQLFVRTNEPRSVHLRADLESALETEIDGIMVPKLEMASDLGQVNAALARAEDRSGRALALIGMIETSTGVVGAEALAASRGSHLVALAFGAEDFITDIGGRRTADGLEVLYARSRVVLAARASRLEALDQVFIDIRDDDGFRRDAAMGCQLGFSGKMCVVPRQVEIANETFSPSAEEIERSRRLIQTYNRAKAEGRGAIEFEGGMVDEPLVKRAEAIVELAARRSSAR